MWSSIKQYPVAYQALVQAILALGCSFGLGLNGNQIGAILTVSAALLAVVTHRHVTPIVNPRTDDGAPLVRGNAATEVPVGSISLGR